MDFPTLETERLLLREWGVNDAEALFALYSNKDVVRYTPIHSYKTIDEAIAKVMSFRAWWKQNMTGIAWVVELKETEKVIGECSMHLWDPKHFRSQTGYAFLPEVSGNGYATEAMKAIVEFAFNDFSYFKLNRLEATTDTRNLRSIKVLERLGFTKEGLLRQYEFEKGEFVDILMYAMYDAPRKQDM